MHRPVRILRNGAVRPYGRALSLLSIGLLCLTAGCQSLLATQEPPATWMPLPTVGPPATETVTATAQPSATLVATTVPTATPIKASPTAPQPTGTEPLVPPSPTTTISPSSTEQAVSRNATDAGQEPVVGPTPKRIRAWRGTVHALPTGAQYDDYFRRLDAPNEKYGIVATDAALEVRLAELRDSGRTVSVWGLITLNAPDYGGTQIVVEQLIVEEPVATRVEESELVEGWLGTVRSFRAGATYDDYFEGVQPPGENGIDASSARLAVDLASYRDTGTLLRIWGALDHGVADHRGSRILVTRLEVAE